VPSREAADGGLLRERREAVPGDHRTDSFPGQVETDAKDRHTVLFDDDGCVSLRQTLSDAIREHRWIGAATPHGLEGRRGVDRPESQNGWALIDAHRRARRRAVFFEGDSPRIWTKDGMKGRHRYAMAARPQSLGSAVRGRVTGDRNTVQMASSELVPPAAARGVPAHPRFRTRMSRGWSASPGLSRS
jgi:hypothetical protein